MSFVLAFLMLWQGDLERAQSLMRAGRIEEAQIAVAAALLRDPQSVSALTVQGRVAMARNDFDLARLSFKRAAALAPESADVQFLLGFFHYVDNDFVQAQPVLERSRKLAPSSPRPALFLALTFEGLAQITEAEKLFQEALRLEAKANRPSVETFVAYARMLLAQGRFQEAQTQVTRALQLQSNSREAQYEQARLDFEAGNFAGCIAHALQALEASGEGATTRQIHFLLSRAYARTGDTTRATTHRRQFEAIPPRLIR